eukprot:TRINITY_DN24276_c0_g1_i1.p1 TRINITY_DN24276_c0_g1~~TRINITY_DN24276_c0_g1_i1.p1  ORF type:complete len:416 (+),score=30.81 TRINITY_DN24276_c0_g1_i1:47-1294(+)
MFRRMKSKAAPVGVVGYAKFFTKGFVNRYLRTVPMLSYCIVIAWIIIPRFGSGLNWGRYFLYLSPDHYDCERYWWRDLLFVNTYLLGFCLPWGWYLTTDFHFALILPLLVLPYIKISQLVGLLVSSLLMLTTLLNVAYAESYVKANSRAASFIWGVVLAWVIDYMKSKEALEKQLTEVQVGMKEKANPEQRDNKEDGSEIPELREASKFDLLSVGTFDKAWVRVCCYFCSFAIFWYVIVDHHLIARPGENGKFPAERVRAHLVLKELLWGLALCLLGTPFVLGHGGVARTALSHPFWCVAGKLTFGAYLSHPLVQIVCVALSPELVYSKSFTFLEWWGACFASYCVAVFLWHFVERPASSLTLLIGKKVSFRSGLIMTFSAITFLLVYGLAISPYVGDANPLKGTIYDFNTSSSL